MERGAATAKREGQLENELLRQRVHELQVLKLLVVYQYLKSLARGAARKRASSAACARTPGP
jgi:hypothetical protein